LIITYRDVQDLKFPVFQIPSDNWSYSDGLLFIDDLLVDDTNMPGDTLGIRRLQTPFTELLPLRRSLISHIGLLKQKKKNFIDSRGVPFTYEKTAFCKLKYYKIRRVDRKGTASLLWVHHVTTSFTIPRPPEDGRNWAGILHVGDTPWMLYEYSKTKLKDTRRKV
tara:strand:+ start:869 stop:1363 length:495 start_codon:yes stop_codon:yes gene_type:complete